MNKNNNIIVLYGPTASGKSSLAIEIAKKHNGAIINADSQQVYREIPIITAQPSAVDMKKAPHKLYGVLEYDYHFSVQEWLLLANEKIIECQKEGHLPIIVGGTGLYIKALLEGLVAIPTIDKVERSKFFNKYKAVTTDSLYDLLVKHDAAYADRISPSDRQRILRALCVYEILGEKYSTFISKKNIGVLPDNNFRSIYLKPDRKSVYDSIEQRFMQMIDEGLLEEVKILMQQYPDSDFKKATGVKELVAYMRNQLLYDDMVTKIQQLTRNYAKRQYTWFNNQMIPDIVVTYAKTAYKELLENKIL